MKRLKAIKPENKFLLRTKVRMERANKKLKKAKERLSSFLKAVNLENKELRRANRRLNRLNEELQANPVALQAENDELRGQTQKTADEHADDPIAKAAAKIPVIEIDAPQAAPVGITTKKEEPKPKPEPKPELLQKRVATNGEKKASAQSRDQKEEKKVVLEKKQPKPVVQAVQNTAATIIAGKNGANEQGRIHQCIAVFSKSGNGGRAWRTEDVDEITGKLAQYIVAYCVLKRMGGSLFIRMEGISEKELKKMFVYGKSAPYSGPTVYGSLSAYQSDIYVSDQLVTDIAANL